MARAWLRELMHRRPLSPSQSMPPHTTDSCASLVTQHPDAHHREHREPPLLLLDHRGGGRGQADRRALSVERSLTGGGSPPGDQPCLTRQRVRGAVRAGGLRIPLLIVGSRMLACRAPPGSYAEMRDVRALVAARAKTLCDAIAVEGRSFDRVDEIVYEI